MTYCFAWKSNNEIYIIADLITSSESEQKYREDITLSSMGEAYKKYNLYFIAEKDTKIYINKNIVVAYAGNNIKTFEDVKYHLNTMIKYLSIEEVLTRLIDMLVESELILAVKDSKYNRLYHVNNDGFNEVDDSIVIGSGSEIPNLNNTMKRFMVTYPDSNYEPKKKLSAATAYIQILSLKNNFLDYGVGGTFCGVCIHNEIEWNDDLLYFFYDDKFESKKMVNMIIRKGRIITGSDFTGITKLFKYKKLDEVETRDINDPLV